MVRLHWVVALTLSAGLFVQAEGPVAADDGRSRRVHTELQRSKVTRKNPAPPRPSTGRTHLGRIAPASARARSPKGLSARKARPRPRWAPVEVLHINRRETLQLRIADSRGRPVKSAQKTFDRFFRCHHTNRAGRMNPRLMRLIYQVGRHYDGRRLEVISGYRDPSVAKNPKSPHKTGLACDFRIAGVSNRELRDYLRKNFDHVGVGYYPNSSFVHLDVREGSSAFWIDYSGPGENAVYAENPNQDLKTGRADQYKPAVVDPAWVHQPVEPQQQDELNAGSPCCADGVSGPQTAQAPGDEGGAATR